MLGGSAWRERIKRPGRTPENLRTFSKNFLRKLKKSIFKKMEKPCVNFARGWTRNTNCWGKIEKTLKIFDENSIEKLKF